MHRFCIASTNPQPPCFVLVGVKSRGGNQSGEAYARADICTYASGILLCTDLKDWEVDIAVNEWFWLMMLYSPT